MKVAVTGAGGFIGRNLLRELSRNRHEIIALRHRHSSPPELVKGATWIKADIHDIDSLRASLNGVFAVYHLVGIIAETRTLTFEKTVVGGTRNLIEACRSIGVRKIIYLSALGTSSSTASKYLHTKWLAEEVIRNSGLDYIILRPSIVFGPEDKFVNRLARMIKLYPFMPIIGDGRQRIQPIFVNDLIAIMIDSLSNDKALNKTIQIGGPEEYELLQLIALLKKLLKKSRINLYIPLWTLKIIAAGLEKIMKPAPITTDQLKMLKAGNICDNREMLELFNMELTGLEDGLRKYLR